ncbi:MAG: response regulator [Proteobacteria bacterium]|jgi:two-component system response regulator BaeR|nr:two-component system response regulator BaeR [Methylibium sp.]MBY0365895.1 response regulator [Burkholderiaceae bacterium]MCH8855913.1 response regulator [Pseudomonadota bacterium]|mmetsp:Transcript_15068/g.35736  ORF Transcript_15068/g.35736 Transcript_15068/m.35736 type:complete len:230 (-) Transcript_15068:413-1102(-)
MTERVLVVEDEPKLAALVCDYLRAAGLDSEWLADGRQALERLQGGAMPAALILDLMLPGLDGLELCRAVRAFSDVPILICSARVEELDRLLGLELGADDYVCKPFSPRELVARVKALLRRAQGRLAPVSWVPAAGGFAIDEAGQRILWQAQGLALTPVEFRLLRQLLQHPRRVFERAQLLDLIHEDFRDVSDRVVDSHIKNIRRKLAALDPPQECIASVYGVGYRMDLP